MTTKSMQCLAHVVKTSLSLDEEGEDKVRSTASEMRFPPYSTMEKIRSGSGPREDNIGINWVNPESI